MASRGLFTGKPCERELAYQPVCFQKARSFGYRKTKSVYLRGREPNSKTLPALLNAQRRQAQRIPGVLLIRALEVILSVVREPIVETAGNL